MKNIGINSNLPIQVSSVAELKNFGIKEIVVAIGVFDGVHLGHRKIISELITMSQKYKAAPVLITFYPHPRKVLNYEKDIKFIYSQEKKALILKELGIEAVVTIPFTNDLANLSPEEFIDNLLLVEDISLKGICVGKHWKFGKGGHGNAETLKQMSLDKGFEFLPVEEVKINGSRVSSSTIRKAIANGDFNLANKMLCK